jgi:hypothetical protein
MATFPIEINDLHVAKIKASQKWKHDFDDAGPETIEEFIVRHVKREWKAVYLDYLAHQQKVVRNDADTAAVLADRAAVEAESAAMSDMD